MSLFVLDTAYARSGFSTAVIRYTTDLSNLQDAEHFAICRASISGHGNEN